MKIYIELLILFVLFFGLFIWFLWFKLSERGLRKKYKPENDKGRKGSPPETKELGTRKSNSNSNGFEQSEGREFLQKTSVDDVRKNINSSRKLRFRRRN